jgi:hypothetical protein
VERTLRAKGEEELLSAMQDESALVELGEDATSVWDARATHQ